MTETPVSWVRRSSPMNEHLTYVFNNRRTLDLSESRAVTELRALIGKELSRHSTKTEVDDHINRHYRNPNFTRSGMCAADIFQQDAHGYYTSWYPGHAMLHVDYFVGHGKFLFAEITYDGQQDAIYLCEPVDVYNQKRWAYPASDNTKTSPRNNAN